MEHNLLVTLCIQRVFKYSIVMVSYLSTDQNASYFTEIYIYIYIFKIHDKNGSAFKIFIYNAVILSSKDTVECGGTRPLSASLTVDAKAREST